VSCASGSLFSLRVVLVSIPQLGNDNVYREDAVSPTDRTISRQGSHASSVEFDDTAIKFTRVRHCLFLS